MARVKRGTIKAKRRRNILSKVKGYRFGRSTKKREAKEAFAHAGAHAFAHRRKKKGDFRRLWNIRINAGVRPHAMSYSTFISALKKKDIALNRKSLAQLASEQPAVFDQVVETVKK